MFKILQTTFRTGAATARYPSEPAPLASCFRGRPQFHFELWDDSRPAAGVCPTECIAIEDCDGVRRVSIDYGRCVFCGLCAQASPEAVAITRDFELAAGSREALIVRAEYALNPDGKHERLLRVLPENNDSPRLRQSIQRVLGRSLAIRQVDAGSCNGCELEITALNNPVHDIERFGIHFVASPRHADMLLVTGPVTRNMEQALVKTYQATPDPKVVVAVGACGISGGIFGANYATVGAVDRVVPVDVYIPGCPPRPQALLHGILLAVGRLARKLGTRTTT